MDEKKRQGLTDFPAERARQGEIILRSRLARAIFIAGLVLAVALAFLLSFGRA